MDTSIRKENGFLPHHWDHSKFMNHKGRPDFGSGEGPNKTLLAVLYGQKSTRKSGRQKKCRNPEFFRASLVEESFFSTLKFTLVNSASEVDGKPFNFILLLLKSLLRLL